MANKQSNLVRDIADHYSAYHEGEIITNRFSHSSFIAALKNFEEKDQLSPRRR